MAKLLFCSGVVLVASLAAHLRVGNATSPRTNGTANSSVAIKNATSNAEATTTTTTTRSRTNVTKNNSTTTNRSIGNATEYKTHLTKKNSTTTRRNIGNATAPRTNLTKKNSTIIIANTTSTTVTTTTIFVFPSSQLPHTWTAANMPMVIDVPVRPAALISGVHVVSDHWMKRPKDIEIKLLGSSSGSSSPSILASVSTVYPASLTICGPNGDLPCNYPVTPTSTHKVSINSSDLVSNVRVSLLSPLNAAGTPNDVVIIQEVVVVIPGQTTSPAPPSGNVLLEMFAGGVNCGHMPALNGLTKVQSVQLADINIPLSNNNNPKIYGWQTGNNWVASFTATLLVSAGGFYTFSISLGNADTAELWVNGQRIIQSGCSWGLGAAGGLTLTSGTHSILLWYADDGWNDRVILSYQGSDTGGSSIVVPSSRFVLPITSTTSTTTTTSITTNTTATTTTCTTASTTTANKSTTRVLSVFSGFAVTTTSTTSTNTSTTATTNITTITATQAIATIRVVISVADPTAFNLSAYVAALAESAPTAASVASTVVEGFRVTTSYTFTETITASNAQAAIAVANNVATSQVQVSVTFVAGGLNRRLQGQPNYTVKANITVPEASKAKAVQSTAASPAALSSALQQVGVIHNFAPVVAAAPVATVNVKTVLPAAQSNAVMASPTALQNAAAQANGLGITVVQYVAPPTTTTATTMTATSSFLGTAAIGANSTSLRGSTTKYIADSASSRVPTCRPLFQILAIWAVSAPVL